MERRECQVLNIHVHQVVRKPAKEEKLSLLELWKPKHKHVIR